MKRPNGLKVVSEVVETYESTKVPRKKVRWAVSRSETLFSGHFAVRVLIGLSQELQAPTYRLAHWRDIFLAAGTCDLKSHPIMLAGEARERISAFIACYSEQWLIERLNSRSPVEARLDLQAEVVLC